MAKLNAAEVHFIFNFSCFYGLFVSFLSLFLEAKKFIKSSLIGSLDPRFCVKMSTTWMPLTDISSGLITIWISLNFSLVHFGLDLFFGNNFCMLCSGIGGGTFVSQNLHTWCLYLQSSQKYMLFTQLESTQSKFNTQVNMSMYIVNVYVLDAYIHSEQCSPTSHTLYAYVCIPKSWPAYSAGKA